MNVRYTLSFLCFLLCYIVIQCTEDETIAEIRARIAKENLALRQTYELTLALFKKDFGSKLTLAEVLYVLGECNKRNIYQYFLENNVPEEKRSSINPDLLGDIVRKICEKNGTKALDFLERVNNSMRYILGYY